MVDNRKWEFEPWMLSLRDVIEYLKDGDEVVLAVAQPFRTHGIPLAPILQELRRRGIRVALVTPDKDCQRQVAKDYALPFIGAGNPWSGDPEAAERLGRIRVQEGNERFCEVLFSEYFAAAARDMVPDLERIIKAIGPENVKLIADCSDFAARMVGEKLGVEVTTFDNGLVRTIMENWKHIRPVLNQIRSEHNLPEEPAERPAGYDRLWTPAPKELILDGLDLPGLRDYQRAIAKQQHEGLPPGVFESDRPHVYAMMGSSGNLAPGFADLFQRTNIATAKALTAGGYDALFSVAGGADAVRRYKQFAGPNVRVVPRADQPLAIKHADVYLGHGGFGGLTEALVGRTPMVIVPQFADQQYNALALERAGMGVAFSDSRDATPEAIRAALDEVLSHPERYAAAAQRLGDRLMSLPTLAEALEEIMGPAEMPGGTVRTRQTTSGLTVVEAPTTLGGSSEPVALEGEILTPDGTVVDIHQRPAGQVETPEVETPDEEIEGPADEVEIPEVEPPADEVDDPADDLDLDF